MEQRTWTAVKSAKWFDRLARARSGSSLELAPAMARERRGRDGAGLDVDVVADDAGPPRCRHVRACVSAATRQGGGRQYNPLGVTR